MLTENLLAAKDIESIRKIPKADVHAHMVLSAPFSAYQEVFESSLEPPPDIFTGGLPHFLQYLKTAFFPHFRHPDQLRYILQQVLQHMVEDGIVYTELSFDIRLPLAFGISWETFVILVEDEISKFREHITVHPDLGMAREIDEQLWRENAEKALATKYFKGVDIYGDELAREIGYFSEYLRQAKEQGLKIKIHSGEVGDAVRVLKEYEHVQPDAIQHGIRASENSEVLEALVEARVTVNVCPASNMALRLVNDYSCHPIADMLRAGLRVTVNTDDYAIFGTSLSEEYLHLFENGLLTAAELELIRVHGLKENASENNPSRQ